MKRDILEQAMNCIRPEYLAEAAKKKQLPLRWVSAVAAVLAIVLLLQSVALPLQVKAVSTADYPKYIWKYRGEEMDAMQPQLADFFARSMSQTLSGAGSKNQAYSPANLYLSLSVGAELTGGNTRQQILDVLGAGSMEQLRQQMHTLWTACYYDKKDQTLLANSLWLSKGLQYKQDTMDLLADNYYTSVYQAEFGKSSTNKAIANWLDDQTGGVLQDSAKGIRTDPETVLAAYSTVYYRAMWVHGDEFSSLKNTDGTFHAPDGDVECTFMNKKEVQTNYYWGEDFGAVYLGLRDGSQMWFILPDEGKTVEDVLEAGEYTQFLLGDYDLYSEDGTNHKYLKVNLSVPKFDIQASGDLKEDLQAMGIADIFTPKAADFSASVESQLPVYLTAVNQATRVAIDEEGVTAASYIELPGAGAAPPPEEIIDFILDRPFLFAITNRYDVPLFCGAVNNP